MEAAENIKKMAENGVDSSRLAFAAPELLALESVDAGYYLRRLDASEEIMSPGFRQLFGLEAGINTLHELESVMDAGAYVAIGQILQDLEQGATEQATLNLSLHQGRQHVDALLRVAELNGVRWIVLWARDVTKARRDLQRLQQENTRIKQDLKGMGNLLNTLPIPIWMRSPELTLKFCNLAYMEAAELSPDTEPDLGQLELYKQAPQLAQTAWEKGESQKARRHFVMDGDRRLLEFHEIPADDKSFIAGYATDLSEMEGMREELQRHISAQADLLESSASAMAIFGADKRLKFFNNAYVKLWKLDEAWLNTEPSYREILEVLRENRSLPEQVNFAVYKQEHAQLFTDLIEPHEEFYYLPDGRTLRVLAIPHALGGLLFAYEDVTDRLALERSYNTLIAVQRATLDNLHEAVAALGENGRLQLTNPAYLSLWGLEPEMVTDAPHISDILERTKHLYRYDDWADYKQQLLISFQQRSIRTERVERTDGRVLDLLSVPLPDGATLLTYLDVTDSTLLERSLREQNEALEAADRLKSEFLANVSYELRSPLTSISGFAQMLREDYFGPLNVKQREYVESIHHAAQQLSTLINDILDIANIESGNAFLDLQPRPVKELLQKTAEMLRPEAESQGIDLVIDAPDSIGEVLMDTMRLCQGLVAVAQGAMKYIQQGGAVALGAMPRAARGREEVVLWVEERLPPGKDMPLTDEEGRGGAFYRLTASGFRKSGAGLQMSMAKSYVQLHGGRVELATLPDGTTRVMFVLPR